MININKNMLRKYIIKTKFQLRDMYKQRNEYAYFISQDSKFIDFNKNEIANYTLNNLLVQDIEVLRNIKKNIKFLELNNDELKRSIEETKEKSKQLLDKTHEIGEVILDIHTFIDTNFSLQEKIYLISGNTESCNEIIRFNKESGEKEPGFLDLILQHGEYQNNKQRAKECIDCPKWEMPLFNAILHPMIKRMNKAGISILNCPIFEQLPYYTMDDRGNLQRNSPEIIRQDKNVTIVRF